MSFTVTAGNRVTVLKDIVTMRCFVAVGIAVFLHRLDPTGVVEVKAKDVPGWARKGVRDAFRFYRERAKYSIDF